LKTKIAGKRKLASTLPASSAFGEEDEEEVQVERRLIPIEYTPEELAAAAQPASTMAEEERREAIREGEAAAAKAQAAAAAAAKAAAKAAAAVTAKRLKGSVDWTAYVTEDAVRAKRHELGSGEGQGASRGGRAEPGGVCRRRARFETRRRGGARRRPGAHARRRDRAVRRRAVARAGAGDEQVNRRCE
jgi:hypothetical protein